MLQLVLWFGLVSSCFFTVLVLLSWRFSPKVWIADVTGGEESASWTWANISWTFAIMLSFVGGALVAAWVAASDHGASIVEAAVVAFGVMLIVNIVDLVVVDIGVYLWIRPSWMTIEGVEMPSGVWMHVRDGLNGLVMALPLSVVFGAISALVRSG